MQKYDELLTNIESTLDDLRFSKKEKKEVKELLSDKSIGADDIEFIRGKIFDFAREKLDKDNAKKILDWLEVANKALVKTEVEDYSKAYFSPEEECAEIIKDLLKNCRKSADICVFTITDNRIASAILEAHKRGVKIRIISDDEKASDLGSDIRRLFKSGIEIKVDNSSNHMHHKFALFDNFYLLTGSYNWTRSADNYNHENFIVINNRELVDKFGEKFSALWGEMELY